MTISSLTYQPTHGFLHHWLVAGPVAVLPADDPKATPSVGLAEQNPGLPIIDAGPLDARYPGTNWRYYRCLEDHWVDLTAPEPSRAVSHGWAYAVLDCPPGGQGQLHLAVEGCAAGVWLNGAHSFGQDRPAGGGIARLTQALQLQPGRNELLVRLETAGDCQTACRMALQVQGWADADLCILLPTAIEPELLALRQRLERVVSAAYLDRYVYGYLGGDRYDRNEPVSLHYPASLAEAGTVTHRLQSLAGDIFQETTRECQADALFELARTFPLRNGPHHLAFLPPAKEYYEKKLRFERKELFFVARTDFATRPAGTFAERVQQALEDAARRRNAGPCSELAKMGLGWWDKLDGKALQAAILRIQERRAGSVEDLLAVLAILLRFGERLPSAAVKTGLEACVTAYRYESDSPGEDCLDFTRESEQILYHAGEILAGQLFPRQVFAGSGQTGAWHRQHGESLALAWMQQRGAYGFQEWDSPASVERVLAALAHLVDLAASQNVGEMAAILMDKVFFDLALNSWQGIYGASRGFADTPGVLSPRLEATSGICRLMWGLGNFNEAILGTVSLALCEAYELPALLEKIALDATGALWARQGSGQPGAGRQANRVTYRTSDFILASAQDYAPGQPGRREHVWQAALGPDAVVFTNHPANMNVETCQGPDLWAGNRVLPRVAQWGDVLVALYQLPEDDWMGFTHAYFPASAFDEHHFAGKWAFARKGKGYLALYADQGMQWITAGKTAFRELRSPGLANAWVCQLGQEMLDGSFAEFQRKALAMPLQVAGLHVELAGLRGESLSFGWREPLQVNGAEQALSDFPHYETPFCTVPLPAAVMDIVYQEEGLRLKFA